MTASGARSTGFLGRLRGRDHAKREVTKTEEAWRAQLTPEQFRVLRRRGGSGTASTAAPSPLANLGRERSDRIRQGSRNCSTLSAVPATTTRPVVSSTATSLGWRTVAQLPSAISLDPSIR